MTYALRDSATMLRRNLRRQLRYPVAAASAIGVPLVFLLLFYVFGGTMGAGLPGVAGGRDEYLDYVTPGILLLAAAGAAQGVAIAVAMDMTEGIIARFRVMDIARGSVLTGHVLGSLIQTLIAMAVVLGVALALGFGPTAGALDWLAAIALLAMIAFALTWLSVALGMATRSVETASNLPLPLILLPFLGSGFVPTESMPDGVRAFAEHQPFTPVIDTLRAFLEGRDPGADAAWAVGWCLLVTVLCFAWSRRLFSRVRAG